ncbi:hypothetical protein EXN66_Car006144 [Channa argus]|uniref:UPAR/Ly6 domain-containing protein n=1 Tax=Channa argus TaxID=215402 RepID=A0A6G1PJG0_CHAAH|nr:hypothetical protein EXN66_Car006144 [Channa argus]
MMKLILSVTIVSWMLFSTAAALQCQQCSNETCSATTDTTCEKDSACLTSSGLLTVSGVTDRGIIKTCVPASTCALGNQTFSQSVFNLSIILNASCCNTDNCNSGTLNFPTTPLPNNLQCYTCESTSPGCIKTQIQCKGVEDRCFRSEGTVANTTVVSLGCTSTNLCTAGSNLDFTASGSKIQCCGTPLCNAASTTTTTTMYFLLGLLLFSFY